jgi:hypothetical protein
VRADLAWVRVGGMTSAGLFGSRRKNTCLAQSRRQLSHFERVSLPLCWPISIHTAVWEAIP